MQGMRILALFGELKSHRPHNAKLLSYMHAFLLVWSTCFLQWSLNLGNKDLRGKKKSLRSWICFSPSSVNLVKLDGCLTSSLSFCKVGVTPACSPDGVAVLMWGFGHDDSAKGVTGPFKYQRGPGRQRKDQSCTTDWLWVTWHILQMAGEGNGNPLQCSCLENPRDRGAW